MPEITPKNVVRRCAGMARSRENSTRGQESFVETSSRLAGLPSRKLGALRNKVLISNDFDTLPANVLKAIENG